MNYHWNWYVFFEPSPNGTGAYLDMLLSGLVVTIVTALGLSVVAFLLRRAKYFPLAVSSRIGLR